VDEIVSNGFLPAVETFWAVITSKLPALSIYVMILVYEKAYKNMFAWVEIGAWVSVNIRVGRCRCRCSVRLYAFWQIGQRIEESDEGTSITSPDFPSVQNECECDVVKR
jgi:hypothetical protein